MERQKNNRTSIIVTYCVVNAFRESDLLLSAQVGKVSLGQVRQVLAIQRLRTHSTPLFLCLAYLNSCSISHHQGQNSPVLVSDLCQE